MANTLRNSVFGIISIFIHAQKMELTYLKTQVANLGSEGHCGHRVCDIRLDRKSESQHFPIDFSKECLYCEDISSIL